MSKPEVVTNGPRLSTLQQQRSRETRRKLTRAAERLWRTKGFDETSVAELCEAAGVSKGTFYFYFARKEDLLVELALRGAERLEHDWEAVAGTDLTTEEAMRRMLQAAGARTSLAPRSLLARTMLEILAHAADWREVRGDRPDFGRIFTAVVERGQARGEIATRFEPLELAQMLSFVTLQSIFVWAVTAEEALADLLVRRTGVILHGARA